MSTSKVPIAVFLIRPTYPTLADSTQQKLSRSSRGTTSYFFLSATNASRSDLYWSPRYKEPCEIKSRTMSKASMDNSSKARFNTVLLIRSAPFTASSESDTAQSK